MTSTKLCLVLSTLLLAPFAHAAKERPADAPPDAVLLAADANIPSVRTGSATAEAKPASAGVAQSLPDQPHMQLTVWRVPARPQVPVTVMQGIETVSLPDGPGVSTLDASPLAGLARRVGAQRFNTDDGSSADDFAICYRLNNRSSVQVIPGDPAPVKIPVSSMSNNTGVTVGLVVRLFKAR